MSCKIPVEDIIDIRGHGGTKVSIQNTSFTAFLDMAIPNGNDSLKSVGRKVDIKINEIAEKHRNNYTDHKNC